MARIAELKFMKAPAFDIPLRINGSRGPTDPPAAAEFKSGPVRILLLDDDPALSRLMATLLGRFGYIVDTAGDGEEGWTALHGRHYDLLMTDNDMPRLKGVELVRRLRASGIFLPVIVVSGSEEVGSMVDDDQLRLNAVMRKPFNPEELIAQVERACPMVSGAA